MQNNPKSQKKRENPKISRNPLIFLFQELNLVFTPKCIVVKHSYKLYGKKMLIFIILKKVRLYTKMEQFMDVASFFTTTQRKFVSNNIIPLLDMLLYEDRQIFYFDVRLIPWKSCLTDYCLGFRRHILKEKDGTVPVAQIRLMKFYLLQKMIYGLTIFILALTAFHLLFLMENIIR